MLRAGSASEICSGMGAAGMVTAGAGERRSTMRMRKLSSASGNGLTNRFSSYPGGSSVKETLRRSAAAVTVMSSSTRPAPRQGCAPSPKGTKAPGRKCSFRGSE